MPAEGPRGAKLNSRWLTIVGIGEDGLAGLGDEAKRRIAASRSRLRRQAASGAGRFLRQGRGAALAGSFRCRAWRTCWRSPARKSACSPPAIRSSTASAPPSPARSKPQEMHVIPAPSAISLAASRLGWALQDIETISLHGRPLDLIRPLLHPARRILALTSDGEAPAAIARLLDRTRLRRFAADGPGGAGRTERKARSARADAFDLENINPLNVLALEVESTPRGPHPAADRWPRRSSVRA